MRFFLPVPFLIYWLVVTDFRYDLDVCSSFNETGFCLSNLQCSNIAQGKNIGSCDSEVSGSVCCKITMNFFNATYLLSRMFARKFQTEEKRQMILVHANTCGPIHIIYGNKSISPGAKKKIVQFDPDLHVSVSPDRIMWAIYASFSRESRDLRKQSSGQNYLYAAVLDKLDTNGTVTSECLSESNETKSEEEYYVLVNPTSHFPIRKFFTPEIQKLNTMNLTIDAKSLFEMEPEKRSRRSVYHGMCDEDDSTCRKQEWDDIINVDTNEDIESGSETDQNIHKQMKEPKEHENINRVHNYVLESKSMLEKYMEVKDKNKEVPIVKKGEDETPLELVTEELIYDSNKEKTKDLIGKGTVKFETPSLSVKGDSVSIKADLRTDVDANMESVDLPVHNLQKSAPIESYPYTSYTVQVESTDIIQKPVQVDYTNDMRKPLKVDDTHDLKKSAQTEDSRNLRIPVQTEATHDSRKVVQKEPTHDMRIPVQIYSDHNMRKPIQIVRESVKIEVTHDLRKPVDLNESHDLRWPVLDGETDLRSPRTDSDASGELDDGRSKLSGNRNARLDDISLDCNVGVSFSNKKSTLDFASGKEKQFNDVWKEAARVCGKYTEDTTENSSRKVKREWPWMVYLHEKRSGKYSHKCSAALLNNLWVITVAHCVNMKQKSVLKLLLGSQNDKGNYTEMDIDEIIIHPRFNRGMLENDIGLLRMKTPVEFQSTISPICLPWSVGELQYGTPVFLGRESKDQRNYGDLEQRTVPLITNYECGVLYSTGRNKEKIRDTFLCAAKDEESCDSESGSSLIALNAEGRWSLIGLVSWGSMCESPEQPGVYVRISSYAQWIKNVIDCYENLL